MKIRVGYELIYDFPQPTPTSTSTRSRRGGRVRAATGWAGFAPISAARPGARGRYSPRLRRGIVAWRFWPRDQGRPEYTPVMARTTVHQHERRREPRHSWPEPRARSLGYAGDLPDVPDGFAFGPAAQGAQDICRRYALDGDLLKSGDKLRVRARLTAPQAARQSGLRATTMKARTRFPSRKKLRNEFTECWEDLMDRWQRSRRRRRGKSPSAAYRLRLRPSRSDLHQQVNIGQQSARAKDGSVATILAHDARGRWASSGRLAAHAALSNKSAMTTAWPRIS